SQTTGTPRPPARSTAAAAASTVSRVRDAHTTCQPFCAKWVAIARPRVFTPTTIKVSLMRAVWPNADARATLAARTRGRYHAAMEDRPILNVAALEYRRWGHGERFEARVAAIGGRLGAQKLGYNVTVLPPGKRAFPFHNHRVNEEMF